MPSGEFHATIAHALVDLYRAVRLGNAVEPLEMVGAEGVLKGAGIAEASWSHTEAYVLSEEAGCDVDRERRDVLDAGLERIADHLGRYGAPITIVNLQVFEPLEGSRLLIREVTDEETRPARRAGRRNTVEAIRHRAREVGVETPFDRFLARLGFHPERSLLFETATLVAHGTALGASGQKIAVDLEHARTAGLATYRDRTHWRRNMPQLLTRMVDQPGRTVTVTAPGPWATRLGRSP